MSRQTRKILNQKEKEKQIEASDEDDVPDKPKQSAFSAFAVQ